MIELGSSDAPVILGCSPHSTPWQLWAEKVGLIPRVDEPDEVMRAGTKLEPVVIAMALDELGVEPAGHLLYSPETREYHPERKWQRDTSDALIFGEMGRSMAVMEVKCVIGQPPPAPRVDWIVQCLHHLLVWEEANVCHLACFGGLRLARWEIPRHQQALDVVLRAEEHFLDLIEHEEPPPVRAEDGPSLWRAWPLVRDAVVTLPVEAIEWDRRRMEADRVKSLAEMEYEWAGAQIRAVMGAATKAVLPDGTRYTWRPYQRGGATVRPLRRSGGNGDE